jgi:methionine-rich copper-binding protein CopC
VKVPFNAHGYVRFTEPLIARQGIDLTDPTLVVTQSNIKNWIKVWTYDASGANPVELTSAQYVIEFVNPERTHARITFQDPEAPSIGGYTYNLKDEWNYAIVVNRTWSGYMLQDMQGNLLFDDDTNITNNQMVSRFKTEDITAPNFYVTTCNLEGEKVQIKITPWQNTNPYNNGRNYPPEAGKAYYVVRPAGTTVTANNLYNKTWSDVGEIAVSATTGATVTVTLPAEISGNYNYTVYAVMQDSESDLYVASTFNNAWVTTDPIFIASGDANPATGAIGIADIRPAPNKNMTVKSWNFCFCDDDKPFVVSKQWNTNLNVEVDETFEIKFNEDIALGAEVNLSGTGTGGTVTTPNYGYEVRLREWNNNIAVPITITLKDSGFVVSPVASLQEETRYYIEIDRWVVWDVPGSTCKEYTNVELPQGFPAASCTLCSTAPYQNNFPGWIGRSEWWFQTTDNTAPVLTFVSPLGACVPVNNNKIVFTFKEKNEMVIKQLAGINTNSIYIYKQGSTIPYEVIPAANGAVVRTGTDTWTITYTTLHPYNSEEIYTVEWNKGIFVDNAIPVQHNYTETLGAVVDGQTAAWHKFSFTSEDNLKPVASWAFMNRLWVEEFANEDYAYPLAKGSFNSNDVLAASVNVCSMYPSGVPQVVGFYVWFNEPVALTSVTQGTTETTQAWRNRWINENFYLTSSTGSVSLYYLNHGTAASNITLPNGAGVIPAGAQWYYFTPNGVLESLAQLDFGIKAAKIKDVNATDCRVNTLGATKLFNFCVWDATAPTAKLYDALNVEIVNTTAKPVATCVEEGDYFHLVFSKPVVKTTSVVVDPQFGNPNGGPAWWTYENLYLTVADLMDNGGQIYEFRESVSGDLVEIMGVEIVVPGKEYKIFTKDPLKSEVKYEFEIFEDVLKDLVRIPNGNFYPGYTWTFNVTDWEAPYVVAVSPLDEAQNISPVSNLTITFNEEVSLGTSARIIIRDNGVKGLIYSFRADDGSHVTLSANKMTVTINHDGLNKNDMYYVQVEPGFVKDASCKFLPFEGKFEQGLVNDSWNFKTGDIDGPVAMLWPTPGDDCVPIDADLVIRFDENITLTNKGKLVIYKVIEGGSFHNPLWPNAMFGDVVAVIPFTNANYPQVKISGSDAPNGLTANIVTVTAPLGLWESKATYYVRILGDGVVNATEADVVVDAVGNTWAYPVSHSFLTELPGIHHNQWYFTIGNNDEPVLVSMTPVRGETVPAGVASATTNLTMTFEEAVAFGNGKIKIFEFIVAPQGGVAAQKANLWREFNIPADVASGKVSLSADMKTVTVHDVALLDGITWYYVLVEPGAITNNIECTHRHWGGISNPDIWLFNTAPDVTDPVLVANAVTSDACSEVYLNPSTVAIELHFSEDVSVANGTGLVQIKEAGVVVSTATITAAHINGKVVTLSIADFNNAIADQKAYTIVIGGNAIHDKATASMAGTQNPVGLVPFGNGNWFAGAEIQFHTGDFTAPVAINFEPNMVVDLENDVTLKVWFSEPVHPGTGMLRLFDAVSGQEWKFKAENAVWSADMKMLSYDVALPDETSYYVLIDTSFVTDKVYMESCDGVRGNVAVTKKDAWTFAIDDNTVPAIVKDLTEDVDNLMMSFEVVLEYDDVITYVDASKAILWFAGFPTSGGVTGAEIGTDPTTVIIKITAPQDQTGYMLQLNAGFVKDDAINPNASKDTIVGPYYVGDRTAPVLEAAGPTGILPSYIGVEVFVDFFDDSELTVVAPITIKDATGKVVATWTPVLDNNQAASFMPELWFGEYTVTIPAGAVVDENGNKFAGFTWNFAIIDNIAPNMDCLTIVNPKDGATGILANVNLVMEFCERMAAGNQNMLVKVYEILEVQGQLGQNSLFYSTPVTTAMVSLTTVTIPLTGLKDNTSYIVLIDNGAITDEAGNAFGGIYDPTVWNFTTGDNTAPTVVLEPAGATNAINEFVVKATFSEKVVGAIEMIKVEGAESFVVTSTDQIVYHVNIKAKDGATVKVTVPVTITDVPDAKGYGNPLAAAVSGTYVVGDNTAPTVAITSQPANVNSTANEFTVVLTFSEEVTGVEAALAGSTGLVNWTVNEAKTVYTLHFKGIDNAKVKLHLDATKVSDVSANANKLAAGLDVTYTVGCNNPEIINVAIETFIGEEVLYVNAAKGISTMLGAGVHTLTFTMENGCTGSVIVTVTEKGVLQATIAAIQGTSWASPVEGKMRGITGTVTGVVPGVGYYVQDANAPWSGIFVADATTILFEGNGVHVNGVVSEVNGVTTLTGTGSVVNPPLAIVPIVLASPELAKDEQYESVNVKVKGVRANAAKPDGTWDVYTESTKVLTIGKWMYIYTPVAGHFYDVTGIVNGANDLFKLEPRKLADVVDLTSTTDISVIDAIDFKVYPNPFNNELNIDNHDKLTRVTLTNIAGQRVMDVQYPERVIRTANLVSGVYVVTLFNEDGIVKSERIVKR